MVLGFGLVLLCCFVWFVLVGEYPYRLHTWLTIITGYFFYEVFFQGWRGWDTCEDTIFVCFYGAGSTLYTVHEVTPGSTRFWGDISSIAPFFYVAVAHLFLGVMYRYFSGKSPSKG